MALSDGPATPELLIAANIRAQAYMASKKKENDRLDVGVSEMRSMTDELGIVWNYVVIGDGAVRMEKCDPSNSEAVEIKIPSIVEGLPVKALAPDCCSDLPGVEAIICPDSVEEIGACAFRVCKDLVRLRLPENVSNFDSHWFRSCSKLEDLVLPGRLEKIDSRIFDMSDLKRIVLGACVNTIEPGTFAKSELESIEISDENPHLKVEGPAVYSKDGKTLIALAIPKKSYSINEGCEVVGKKAFSNFECLSEINFAKTVRDIGEFACSRTSIEEFRASESLKKIEKKAFYSCAKLESVVLNDGLETIEEDAFSDTSIKELHLPATIKEFANSIASGTGLEYSGSDATFTISKDSPTLILDEEGGLYRIDDGVKHFARMMDPDIVSYTIAPDTEIIDSQAFLSHANLEEVKLSDSVRLICDEAFRNCRKLKKVDLSRSLEEIGKEAFQDTVIESLSIPTSLMRIGDQALVTYGARHGSIAPSIHTVDVDPANEKFYGANGLFLERKSNGAAKVILCTDDVDVIDVPEEVDEIASYAFNGARNIREIHLSDKITSVGVRGLAMDCSPSLVHIDLVEPIEGHTSFDFRFPSTDRGAQQMSFALSMPPSVSVEAFFEHYDTSILNASSFDSLYEEGLDLYEQAILVMDRLADPVFLNHSNENMCKKVLEGSIEKICVEIAKHDDRASIDKLVDLGFLNADNILQVIDRVSAVQDASMTGYLLELQRTKFSSEGDIFGIDFEL